MLLPQPPRQPASWLIFDVRRHYAHHHMKASLITLTVTVALLSGCVSSPPNRDQPPSVAGQPAPNQNIVLDFSKRYDLVCRDAQSTRTLPGCRILGYTGESVRDSSGIISKEYYGHFGRWLVVELSDGRRACLPPASITYLEESK
jgi:hypothetical protein